MPPICKRKQETKGEKTLISASLSQFTIMATATSLQPFFSSLPLSKQNLWGREGNSVSRYFLLLWLTNYFDLGLQMIQIYLVFNIIAVF